MISVNGCEKNIPLTDSYCLHSNMIFFHPDDVMNERTETAIILHNQKIEKLCGEKNI
jgi:hypothetical protein